MINKLQIKDNIGTEFELINDDNDNKIDIDLVTDNGTFKLLFKYSLFGNSKFLDIDDLKLIITKLEKLKERYCESK